MPQYVIVYLGGDPLPHAEPIEDGPPEDVAAVINRATTIQNRDNTSR